MGRSLEKFLLLSGAVSAVLYFGAFTLLFAALPQYNVVDHYISELGATDSSIRAPANILGFFLPGVFFFLFGIGVYRALRTSALGIIGGLLLAIGGLCFTAIAIFTCDAHCENFSPTGKIHEFVSDSALYLGSASIFFIVFALARQSRAAATKFVLTVVLMLAIIGSVATYFYLHSESSLGELFQKFAIGIPFAIMGGASLYLHWLRYKQPQPTIPIATQTHTLAAWVVATLLITAILAFAYRDVFLY